MRDTLCVKRKGPLPEGEGSVIVTINMLVL